MKKIILACILALGFSATTAWADDWYGYDYGSYYASIEPNNYADYTYANTTSDGTYSIDTWSSWTGTTVQIYYDDQGNDSGSVVSSGGCSTHFDNQGSEMDSWGSC